MHREQQLQSIDYANAVAALVADMSPERAAQVYDFVCFLQRRPAYPSPIALDEDDWLNDSEEQMQVEDALWEAAQARHHDKFTSLITAARAEIDAGTTEPLFTKNGELKLP
ncbi:MAG: hypothetical protein H6641_16795 [Caldilineaceae bacterium]|nr:hypothetical protein [Caldilineaceae bacterium]